MQFYRRNLPHMQRDHTAHFITFCTKFRRILPDWARDIVLGCCVHDHGTRYRLEAAVVMPDHVHLILTPSTDDKRQTIISLVEIMKAIKGASARAINRRVQDHGAIWQEESFDRIVRSSESLDAKNRLRVGESDAEGISRRLAPVQVDLAIARSESVCPARESP
jgi:REP element-mobilizing transposase RayT